MHRPLSHWIDTWYSLYDLLTLTAKALWHGGLGRTHFWTIFYRFLTLCNLVWCSKLLKRPDVPAVLSKSGRFSVWLLSTHIIWLFKISICVEPAELVSSSFALILSIALLLTSKDQFGKKKIDNTRKQTMWGKIWAQDLIKLLISGEIWEWEVESLPQFHKSFC